MLSITTCHGAEREEDEGSAEKGIAVEEGAARETSDGTGTQAADVWPLTQSGALSGALSGEVSKKRVLKT